MMRRARAMIFGIGVDVLKLARIEKVLRAGSASTSSSAC